MPVERVRDRIRSIVFISLVAAGAVLVAMALAFAAPPTRGPLLRWALGVYLETKGLHLDRGDVAMSHGLLTLRGVQITENGAPFFASDSIAVDYGGSGRALGISAVQIERPRLTVHRAADGSYDLQRIFGGGNKSGSSSAPLRLSLRVDAGRVDVLNPFAPEREGRALTLDGVTAHGVIDQTASSRLAASMRLEVNGHASPVRADYFENDVSRIGRATVVLRDAPLAPVIDLLVSSSAFALTAGSADATLHAYAAGWDPATGPQWHAIGSGAVRSAVVRTLPLSVPVRNVNGPLSIFDGTLDFPALAGTAANVPVAAAGFVELLPDQRLGLRIHAAGPLARVRTWLPVTTKLPLDGRVQLAAALAGAPSQPHVDVEIRGAALRYGAVPLHGLRTELYYHDGHVAVRDTRASYGKSTIFGYGDIDLTASPAAGQFVMLVRAPSTQVPYVASIESRGVTSASLVLSGPLMKLAGSGFAAISGGEQRVRAEAVASASGLAISSIARDPRGGELVAMGTIDRTGDRPAYADVFAHDYAARLNGTRVALSGITHGAVGLPAASGKLSGYASLRGTLRDPLGAVRVTGRDVAVGEQPIGDLYLGAAGSGDSFRVNRLAVNGPDLRMESDGFARLVHTTARRTEVAAAIEGTAHVNLRRSPASWFVQGRADAGFNALIEGGTWVASVDATGPGATVEGTPVRGVRAIVGQSGRAIVVYGASADAAGGHIDAAGTLPGSAPGVLTVSARNVAVSALRAAGLPLSSGSVVALAHVAGTSAHPSIEGAAALIDSSYGGRPLDADAAASYRDGALTVNGARIVAADSVATVDGTVSGVTSGDPSLSLDASLPEADIGALGSTASSAGGAIQGVASARLHASGSLAAPVVTGAVSSDVGTLRGVTYTGMRASLSAGRGGVDIRSGSVTFGRSQVAVQGDVDASGADMRIASSHVNLDDFNDFFDGKDVLEGHGSVDMVVSSDPNDKATGSFHMADTRVSGVPLGDVVGRLHPAGAGGSDVGVHVIQRSTVSQSVLDLQIAPRLSTTSAIASGTVTHLDIGALSPYVGLEDQRLGGIANARIHGTVGTSALSGEMAFGVNRGTVRGKPIKSVNGDVVVAGGGATLKSLEVAVNGATLKARGSLSRNRTIVVHAVADVRDLHALEQYSNRPISMDGSAVAIVDARGPLRRPDVHATVNAGAGQVENVPYDSVQADATLARGRIVAHGGVALAEGHGAMRFGATVPVQTTALRIGPSTQPVSVDAVADGFGVAVLNPFLHDDASTHGTVDGSVSVRGTVGRPIVSGKLALRGVSVASKYDKVPVTDLNGDLTFANDSIDLQRLHGVIGDGTLDMRGSGHIVPATALRKSPSLQYAFGARLTHADVNVPNYLVGTVDAQLGLTKSAAVPYLYGNIGFTDSDVPFTSILALASGGHSGPQPGASFPGVPPVQPHHIVVYGGSVFGDDLDHVLRPTPPPTPAPQIAAVLPSSVGLGLHVTAGKNVGVSGLLNVIGTGTIDVTGDTSSPQLSGTLTAVRGRAGFLNTQFDLLDGWLTFHPKEGLIPTVSADAITRTEDADITVSVYGRVDQLHTDMQSDPPMDQDAIIATLLRVPQINSALASSQGVQQSSLGVSPQNMVTGALAGQILGALNIGLEQVFNLEEVNFGLDPLGHPTLELRKQVSPRAYTLYRTTFTVPPAQAFGIAYQVRRALQVELTQSQSTPGVLSTYATPQTTLNVKVTFH